MPPLSVDEAEWGDIREQSWKANQDGVFVTLPGLEWTKKEGHACIFDPPTRQWPTNIDGFFEAAAQAGVVVKINHPGEGTNVFNGLAYSEVGDQAVELIEVRRPAEELAYRRALRQGWHLAPDGADDTHEANWGTNRSWTGIWAPGLSRRNVWAALKGRHCFSTLDRNCALYLAVNGAVMGEIVEKPAEGVGILVRVTDPDEQDRVGKIELFEDGEVVECREATESEAEWTTGRLPRPGKHCYFVKVTQADGNLMWSAPVWVVVAGN